MTKRKQPEELLKLGRPSTFTMEFADKFCQRLISGRTINSVCKDEDMPNEATIYDWRKQFPDFNKKVACAREEREEGFAQRMIELGERAAEDETFDPNRARVAIDAIDKAARMMKPKTRIELTGKDGEAIQIDDVSAEEGKRRLAALIAATPAKAVD